MKNFIEKLFRALFPAKDPQAIQRKYRIPNTIHVNISLTKDGWFCASSPDLPGLVTQAQSHQELIRMMNDAVLTYFDVPRREGDILFTELNLGATSIRYEGELRTRVA